MKIRSVLLLSLLLFSAHAVEAQVNKKAEIEGGVNYYDLTEGFPSWRGAYIRGILKTGTKDVWYGDVLRQEEFGDEGTFFGIGNTHTINPDWYSFLSVGSSSGGFFLPRVRVDGQLYKKWLTKRNLVTGIGAGYFDSKDIHHDSSVSAAAIYYLESPWVIQGGVRWNVSSPGNVVSRSQYIAVTEGREGEHYIIMRAQAGREAYQAITAEVALVDFPSRSLSIGWKQWIGKKWGFNTLTEYYNSDVYRRTGASFGLFKSF